MKHLYISNDVKIPMNVITKRLAFLGTTGSGKSYGAMKLAEEMLQAGVQVIIFDPVGIHWGLRLSADKQGAGIPINVFGGLYGDVPITPQSGAMIADVVIDKKISAILDVSQFEYDSDKARFASAFAQRFFFRKKAKPSPVHIMLEEAQEFIPQNPEREETVMLHHFVRMWKIGRNFGIGGSIISQRPQEINKKALNLSQCVFAFQTSGHHERKAIDDWVRDKGLDLDIAADLPKLPVGQPHLWSPGWLGISQKIKIAKRITFHPSEEETISYEPERLNKLSPVDIAKLSESIKETIERAKENDSDVLKKKIVEQQREITALKNQKPKTELTESEKEKIFAEIQKQHGLQWSKLLKSMLEYEQTFQFYMEKLMTAAQRLQEMKLPVMQPPELSKPVQIITKNIIDRESLRPKGMGKIPLGTDPSLPEGERKILTAIAQHDEGVDREQISILTGYKRSTRDRYLQLLGQKNAIEIHGDTITASNTGMQLLGASFEPLPKGSELIEYWKNRLTGGEKAIFCLLVDNVDNPDGLSRDFISETTDYKRSTRDRYIQLLAVRKLVTPSNGAVKLNKKLLE